MISIFFSPDPFRLGRCRPPWLAWPLALSPAFACGACSLQRTPRARTPEWTQSHHPPRFPHRGRGDEGVFPGGQVRPQRRVDQECSLGFRRSGQQEEVGRCAEAPSRHPWRWYPCNPCGGLLPTAVRHPHYLHHRRRRSLRPTLPRRRRSLRPILIVSWRRNVRRLWRSRMPLWRMFGSWSATCTLGWSRTTTRGSGSCWSRLTSTKSTNWFMTAMENLNEEYALELDIFEEVRNVKFCFYLNDDLPSSLWALRWRQNFPMTLNHWI